MTFQEFQAKQKEIQAKRDERDARIAALPIEQQAKANHDALMEDHFANLPHYTLDEKTMKNTTKKEFVLYCGQTVILEDIEYTAHGNVAVISFEDGREDQVPLSTIDFLK